MTRWKNESHWRSHDMVTSILKIDSSCSATWTLQKIARDNDVVNENIIDQINRNFDMDDFFKFRFQYRKIVNYRKNNYPSIIEWWFEIGKVAIPWQIIFRRITILRSILKDFRKSSTNRKSTRYLMELRNRLAIN